MSGGLLEWVKSLVKPPTLEIHIPISPTPTFFNMVQCLTLSLRRFGGLYRNAPIILTIGDTHIDHTIADRYPWLKRLGVDTRWIPEEEFRKHSYFATGNARFLHEFKSDVVLLLDADILIARPFQEVVFDVHLSQVIAGMIAPASPLQFFHKPTTWQEIYEFCELKTPPELTEEHPGWPYHFSSDPAFRRCPAYFNYGVIFGTAALFKKVYPYYFDDLLKLKALTNSDLVAQIALTTAMIKAQIGWKTLSVRYNFPNHPMLEALHGDELPLATFLHLKDDHQINKTHLFANLANVRATIERDDLRGVNEIARKVLNAIEPDLVGD